MTKETGNDELTFTRLNSFLTCPWKQYLQYEVQGVGIEPVAPTIPFIEGDFLHYALHFFYKNGAMLRENMIKRVNKTLNELKDAEGGIDPELDDKLQVKLSALIGAALSYKVHYKQDLDEYNVILNEEKFKVKIGDFDFEGKIDLGLEHKETGDTFLLEHKSALSLSRDAYEMLPLNIQDMIYCLGWKGLLGKLPDYRQRNYILKSALRRRKDKSGGRESLLEFEARVTQQYLNEPEKKFFRTPPLAVNRLLIGNVKNELKKMLGLFKNRCDKPVMSFQCESRYGLICPFSSACVAKLRGQGEGWDAAVCRGLYRLKETQHPELQEKDDG